MYTLVSAVIGLTFGFALSNQVEFHVSFLYAFFIAFFMLTFIHTLAKGCNWMFIIACKVFLGMAPIFFLWFIYALPGVIFVLLGFVGGFITAPIWYFISIVRRETTRNVVVGILMTLIAVLVVAGVTLFIKPILVYKLVSYGWVIAAFIVIPIVTILISILLNSTYLIEEKTFKILLLTSLLCIPIMIFGVAFSRNRTYEIYTAADMRAFSNAPNNYKTVFVLQNDIDFDGEDVSWFGKQDEFDGVFEGGGYTLSNIHCETDAEYFSSDVWAGEDRYSFGFANVNNGIIKNLNFKNCSFIVNCFVGDEFSDGYLGVVAGFNSSTAKVYNCTLADCYVKYYRYSYTSGSGWWSETNTQTITAGYIVGSYSGGEKSKFEPNSNVVTMTGIWKPDDEFYETETNWKFVENKYGQERK